VSGERLSEIKGTHDWLHGFEIPVCRKCRMSIIGAHIWGDAEWTSHAVRCGEELSEQGLREREKRGVSDPVKAHKKTLKTMLEREARLMK